jgi:hypothetical protein
MRRVAPSLLASFAVAVCLLLAGAPPGSADGLPGPLGLSLAPWTGPDLPGSVASTIKYRLVLTGIPGAKVLLSESGLPLHWIGSFCSDRVCAPFRSEIVVPADGVKIVEFQVVPTTAAAKPFTFHIAAHSEGHTVATGATVAQR